MIKIYLRILRLLPSGKNIKNIQDKNEFCYRKEYGVTNYQINMGANLISIFFFLFFLLFILEKSIQIQIISIFLALTLRFYLKNYFIKNIKKKINKIDSSIILIKNLFELYSCLVPYHDFCNLFIRLMVEYESPVQKDFIEIANNIQRGFLPEDLLKQYKSISESFNLFIKQLLITNFDTNSIEFDNINKLENNFREINHSLDTRLSLFFFIIIFFPLGLCFYTILQKVNGFDIVIFLLIYLIILKIIMNNFIIDNTELLGINLYENNKIKNEYLEFLNFLTSLSINLTYYNPEESFFHTFPELSNTFQETLKDEIIRLKMYNISLEEFLDKVYNKIQGRKAKILFYALKEMLLKNAFNTSNQIKTILFILNKHKKIEEEREIIIKSEKVRVKIFIYLLPVIIGMIGGILPFMINVYKTFDVNLFQDLPFSIYILSPIDIIIFIISQYIIIIVSGYYFSILSNQNKLITILSMLFIVSISLFFSNFIIGNMKFII